MTYFSMLKSSSVTFPVSHIFLSPDLSPPQVDLFLDILFSVSENLLLVCKNANDFCILILHPTALLN